MKTSLLIPEHLQCEVSGGRFEPLEEMPEARPVSIEGSQMPRRLIIDAHEWINEIPAVPRCWLVNQPPRERAWVFQRGKKTLLSLTLV